MVEALEAKTLPSAFLHSAKEHEQKVAYYYREDGADKDISFGDFIEKAKKVASFLINEGISPGDRVAIISPARFEWYLTFFGVILSGAIAVPVNEMAPEGEVRAMLEDSSPVLVFAAKETAHLGRLIEGARVVEFGSDEFKKIWESEGPEGASAPVLTEPQRGLGAEPTSIDFKAPEGQGPDDTAVLLYTSGTTGPPKGVMLTHKNLISDVLALLETGVVGPEENVLAALPLYHAYPLMGTLIAPFVAGATVTLLHSMKELADVAARRSVTIIVAVPQMLEIMASNMKKKLPAPLKPVLRVCIFLRRSAGINAGKILFKKAHLALGGKLKLLASGGARLAPEVMESLEGFGFTVVEGYGLTETSPVAAFNPLSRRKPGSVGKPIAGAEIKIEDGEVLIRGPMVMKGYWMKPEETSKVFMDGFFRTGDLGYLDKDGYLYITGRKKEMIVLASGKNVNPEEVEKAYGEGPLIKEIGVYEDKGALRAVIVPNLEHAREKKISNIGEAIGWELKEISAKLPSYMRLTGYNLITGPIQKTSLGKIKRYRLKEALIAHAREETDPEILKDLVGKRVAASFFELMGKGVPVRKEKNLELDFGLDSLKKLELLSSLEEKFLSKGERLPDDFLADVQTVGELTLKMRNVSALTVKGEEVKLGPERAVHRFLSIPFALLIKLLSKLLFHVEGKGIENIPECPFILAPNHTSFIDAFVLAAVLPGRILKRLYFQGLRRYFSRFPLSFLGKALHVIPIDEAHLASAIRRSEEALKEGKSLCIFPEGGRSYDGNLMELKKGIAAIALGGGVPVVPVWIKGAYKALPRGSFLLKPVKVRVSFGEPMDPKAFKSPDEFLSSLKESLSALERQEGGA